MNEDETKKPEKKEKKKTNKTKRDKGGGKRVKLLFFGIGTQMYDSIPPN
jgi:hypothetical protein